MPPRLSSSKFRVIARPQCLGSSTLRPPIRQRTTLTTPRQYSTKRKDHDPSAIYNIRKPVRAAAIIFGLVFTYRAYGYYFPSKPQQLDSPPSRPSGEPYTSGLAVELTGKDHADTVEKIPTGTSKVPFFPKTIWLPRSGSANEEGKSAALPAGIGAALEEDEYQLLGLGVRTVSFLSIQVYVVGFYVAKGDMGRLQEELVRAYMPGGSSASTLVQGEKEELRRILTEGEGSERVWGEVLRGGRVRSAVRIVPVRDTNFAHLRDGWLRGIGARGNGEEFEGMEFKSAVDEFKGMMGGKGSVGTGRVLLLGRGAKGDLRAWVEEGAATKVGAGEQVLVSRGNSMSLLGIVKDERISRLVWLGYLAGKNVSSESARQSVIEGVMEVVERPIGTVETQVV